MSSVFQVLWAVSAHCDLLTLCFQIHHRAYFLPKSFPSCHLSKIPHPLTWPSPWMLIVIR